VVDEKRLAEELDAEFDSLLKDTAEATGMSEE